MNKEWTLTKANEEKVRELEKGSALTWEGMNIDEENLDAIVDGLKELTPNVKLPVNFYYVEGKEFNVMYCLTESNAYPDDLHILMIALDNWDGLGKLPMVKFQIGARWLDDIVDNNAIKEKNN